MELYHGSNIVVSEIDLNKCRPNKDFGRGFYLTEIKEQANLMALRTANRFGGTAHTSVFNLDERIFDDESLNRLIFTSADNDWATFVMNNRLYGSNINDKLNNKDNKYDFVYGSVADDDLMFLFREYKRGQIDSEKLVYGLRYRKLSTQYSFHTERAISYLTFSEGLK
ncbi:MAG: DUF3990 domain-containing protein [Ruminococcus sp.]|nr:DUF3990 domain-containing protein [Ruminococcus sp.]